MALSDLHLPAINKTGNSTDKTMTLPGLVDFFNVKNSNIHKNKMQGHNIQNSQFRNLPTTSRRTNVSYGATEDKCPKYTEVSQCCPRTWREQQTVFLPPTTARALFPTTHVKEKRFDEQSYKSLHSARSSRSVLESEFHKKWVKGFKEQCNKRSLYYSSEKNRNTTIDLRITGICCPTSWTVPQQIHGKKRNRERLNFQLHTGKKI
ncbi:uncharacterized protein LOC120931999 [Rana temporaria]|uniref:uncharacterized protein LOC120931999 n=1 Tax=Rana temporaria TaxID=8407 RepID=UPI001AAD12BF|nr:uncharacterized protein LOC120931999 [Rana temporaria]